MASPKISFFKSWLKFIGQIIIMYSPEQTRNLQNLSRSLLTKLEKGTIKTQDAENLKQILRFHEHRYYILNDPLVSDFEYDTLYKELEKIEAEHPELITPDSPTQ